MRKHRLSASFASSAVAAGAAIGTAIATGQPAGKAASTPGPKPVSPEVDHLALAAVNVPTATPAFPGRDLTLTTPWQLGADVQTLQSRYAAHGFHLAIDGIFGPETEGVTRAFQASKGLAVDGIAGPRTWAAAFDQPVSSDPPVVHQAVAPGPAHNTVGHAAASSSSPGVAGGVWAALRKASSGPPVGSLTPRGAPAVTGSAPVSTGPSSAAATAVRWAEEEIGRPYVYGGAGPNGFDCSGLVVWAWGHAGISLPHGSTEQYADTIRLTKSELQPGDLIFEDWGTGSAWPGHVGIYIGNGQMVVADHSGTNVQITSAFRSAYVGAGRVRT